VRRDMRNDRGGRRQRCSMIGIGVENPLPLRLRSAERHENGVVEIEQDRAREGRHRTFWLGSG